MTAVVSAIGALGVGAAVGAVVTYLFQLYAEKRRSDKERKGLLRLVLVEISLHQMLGDLKEHQTRERGDYINDPDLIRNPGRSLNEEAWKQVRPRIAQLLPAEQFDHIATYYSSVQLFNGLLDEHTSPQIRQSLLPGTASGLSNVAPEIIRWMNEQHGIEHMDTSGPQLPL